MNYNKEYILITGGLGYIGSHVSIKLIKKGYNIIIVDNLSNSQYSVMDEIMKISNSDKETEKILYYEIDIRDNEKLSNIFELNKINTVIHMAGLKSVSESINDPLHYYNNNINGTINLLNVMKKFNCKKIIFSSSATVYGNQKYPVDESAITGQGITNPYGKSKFIIEEILKDLYKSDNKWTIIILRYFNPVGHHKSGLLKEKPSGIPNNLFPFIVGVANKTYSKLNVYGNDYNTIDGTCIRDFIHVSDLAKGHISAIEKIKDSGLYIYNLGSGKGTSVLQLIKKFEEINEVNINYHFTERRKGDLPVVYALVDKINKEIGWKSKKTIDDMCRQ